MNDNKTIEKRDNLGLSYNEFVDRLTNSQKTVHFIGEILASKGYKVEIPKLEITPDAKSRADYSDKMDLYFWNGTKKMNVEIKQLGRIFSKKNPPRGSIIVNSLPGFDGKTVKPDWHILVSKDKKCMIIVPLNTKKYWRLVNLFDKVKQRYLWFYVVDMEHTIIKSLLFTEGK